MSLLNQELLDYIKVLSKNDSKTLSQKTLKTMEEVGELAKVILPYDNAFATTHRFADKAKITEEIADSILCLLSIHYDLDLTLIDLEATILEKAKKWQSLQIKAGRGIENIPFEIHVTIKDPLPFGYLSEEESKELVIPKWRQKQFEKICNELGVKCLTLELMNTKGGSRFDFQTSSFHKGTNRTAYETMKVISDTLTSRHFEVVREKIETVPWHPAAPQSSNDKMPADCYFETHFEVVVDALNFDKYCETVLPVKEIGGRGNDYCVLFSSNKSKMHSIPNKIKTLVTVRTYKLNYQEFEPICGKAEKLLNIVALGAQTVNRINEFSVFDSNVSNDDSWVKGEI